MRKMGKLKTDVSKISPTANSGLRVEDPGSTTGETTAVEARVNTRANAADHSKINPNKTAKPPPHRHDLDFPA